MLAARHAAAAPGAGRRHRTLQHRYRARFDGFSMMQYRDGRDGQAFHRDTDMRWLDDTVIAILSLGARRPWLLRPRTNRYDHSAGKGATLRPRPGVRRPARDGRSQPGRLGALGALPAAGSVRYPHLDPVALPSRHGPPVRRWVLPRAAQISATAELAEATQPRTSCVSGPKLDRLRSTFAWGGRSAGSEAVELAAVAFGRTAGARISG